jgi:hypothetical protein
VFHNTFLVAEQRQQASYLHYRSALSPHLRWSFNNIFVAVNPSVDCDVAITFVPPSSFPGPTDGNLYHRFGAQNHAAFRFLGYTFQSAEVQAVQYMNLNELRSNAVTPLFEQSKTQYPPGYEANSLLTDPGFRKIATDGSFHPLDDLRLSEESNARSARVPLPADLQALDNAVEASDNATVLPVPMSRDIGCYRFGSKKLSVGVKGRRRFPIIGIFPE